MTADSTRPAKIIILNGVSSVGKTSLAKAIQAAADLPFLRIAMDDFLGMLPERVFDQPDGITFKTIEVDGNAVVDVTTGPIVDRVFSGMRRAISALADEGNNLIIDDVMFHGGEDTEYRTLLSGHDVRIVGVFASLEVVEKRERARGDRDIGLARGQFEKVHQGKHYDLEIDTDDRTPEGTADAICKVFSLN